MSRTVKAEWSNPDGAHICPRYERKARPAGRDAIAFAADLALDSDWEAPTPTRPGPTRWPGFEMARLGYHLDEAYEAGEIGYLEFSAGAFVISRIQSLIAHEERIAA